MRFRRLVTFGWLALVTAQAATADENKPVRNLTELLNPHLLK